MVENEPNGGQQPEQIVAIPTELKSDFMAKYGDKLQDVTDNAGDDNDAGDGGNGEGDNDKNKKPANTNTNTNTSTDADDGNADAGDAGDGGSAEGDEPSTPLTILAKQYGYDVKDELFKDLDLEDDSIETITEFYNRREELVKQSAVNELVETLPEVGDLISHLQKGGSVETWKEVKQAEALKLEFAKEDMDGKSKFLTAVYKERGLSEKAAKRAIEALIDDNELDAEVETYATKYKETAAETAKTKAEAELKAAALAEENMRKTVTQVTNIVKSGKLSNAVIPDTERKSFNEFVLSEKRDEAFEALTLDQQLFIDYMVFKGFKVQGLVKTEAAKPDPKRVTIKSKGSSGDGKGNGKELTLEDLRKLSGNSR